VLAISADGSFKAAAIHADAFLPKPVGASKLLAEVARILRERSGAAAAASGQLEQLHRLALLGTLTANIEHQLRNPLAFLLTNARLAAESLPELKAAVAAGTAPMRALDDVGGMIDDARAGAERIHAIVEAMGIMARGPGVGTGKASLDVVLDAAVHLCSGHLRHHVQLERAVPPGLEVAGEEPRLLQVLLCLVLTHPVAARTDANARLDFHLAVRREGGAVQIDVEARPHNEFTPPVVLAAARPTVEARQAEAAVGLAVCRTLVERFGGLIESTSASTVRLTLPLAA
jgi:two-component system NtrC family sensor kinase